MRRFLTVLCLLFVIVIFPDATLCADDSLQAESDRLKSQEEYNYQGYNLLLISLGNVGTKYMSLYDSKRKTTPLLDEWSKDAIVFDNLFTPASWTLPVGASLFTSLQPYSHKVYQRRHSNILDKKIQTLPEILGSAGYKTASYTGGLDYDHHFGHMRGFQYTAKNKSFTSFVKTLSQSQEWLNNNKDSKFFLFIHGYDAHCPFNPPEPFKGVFSSAVGKKINIDITSCYRGWETSNRGKYVAFNQTKMDEKSITLSQDDIGYLRDLYDEEVLYEDHLVGQFLNSLDKDLVAKTIIVIFADHGELFAKRGRFGRAGSIRGTYDDAVIHVPLIIKLPGKQSKRVEGFVQFIDLMPTILKMLDLPVPSYAQGKDLIPLIKDGTELNPIVYGGTKYWANKHYPYISTSEFIRDREWKLVHESRRKLDLDYTWLKGVKRMDQEQMMKTYRSYIDKEEQNPASDDVGMEENYQLFNVRLDPDELENVYTDNQDVAQELKQKLDKWIKETSEFDAHNTSQEIFSNKMLKKIKQGGYW